MNELEEAGLRLKLAAAERERDEAKRIAGIAQEFNRKYQDANAALEKERDEFKKRADSLAAKCAQFDRIITTEVNASQSALADMLRERDKTIAAEAKVLELEAENARLKSDLIVASHRDLPDGIHGQLKTIPTNSGYVCPRSINPKGIYD